MSSSAEHDWMVLRAPDIAHFALEGVWFDLNQFPPKPVEGDMTATFVSPLGQAYQAFPTNTFEIREGDGAVAEVWAVAVV